MDHHVAVEFLGGAKKPRHSKSGEDRELDEAKLAYRCFRVPYKGDAHRELYKQVSSLCKSVLKETHYSPYAALVQSSGTGKSRALMEMSKVGVYVCYCSLVSSTSTAWLYLKQINSSPLSTKVVPLADQVLAEWKRLETEPIEQQGLYADCDDNNFKICSDAITSVEEGLRRKCTQCSLEQDAIDVRLAILRIFFGNHRFFAVMLDTSAKVTNLLPENVRRLALQKLVHTVAGKFQGKDVDVLGGKMTESQAMALLSAAAGLSICSRCELAEVMAPSHMELILRVSEDRSRIFVGFPAEPILAEAAAYALVKKKVQEGALTHLFSACKNGYVTPGPRDCFGYFSTLESYGDHFVTRYRASMIKTLLVFSKEKTKDPEEDLTDKLITKISMAMAAVVENPTEAARDMAKQPSKESCETNKEQQKSDKDGGAKQGEREEIQKEMDNSRGMQGEEGQKEMGKADKESDEKDDADIPVEEEKEKEAREGETIINKRNNQPQVMILLLDMFHHPM
ncbi:hypothetical protein L7F22_029629 [Adiantum nelumboides]|nr:hypothetical protein [Adiantum nelumboides]